MFATIYRHTLTTSPGQLSVSALLRESLFRLVTHAYTSWLYCFSFCVLVWEWMKGGVLDCIGLLVIAEAIFVV